MADRFHARALALTLLAAGALAGCGHSSAANRAATGPTPPVDDSTVSIVTPTPNSAPHSGAPHVGTPTSSTRLPGSAGGPAAGGPVGGGTVGGGPVAGGSGGAASGSSAGGTVPGVADGASALPASAAVAAAGRCRISSLRLDPVDLQGSPGGTYADFRLVNISASTCAVRGYVGARLIGDAGKDLATSVRHEAAPDVWVQVARGGAAQFHLRFPNPMSGPVPCNPPNAASVRISLAGLAGTLSSASPEGGIQACNGEVSTAPVGST